MRIPSGYKPEAFEKTSDDHRKNIEHPYYDGESLHYTNGHFLVSMPVKADVDDEDKPLDTHGPVPFSAIKAARKATGKRCEEICILANGSVKAPFAEVEFKRPEMDKPYPDTSVITPPVDRPVNARITLNAEYLYMIQKAFGASTVTIETSEAVNGLIPLVCKVNGYPGNEAKIILMPCRG